MKALFVTPIQEDMKQRFKQYDITCLYRERNAVTASDLEDIDMVFGNLSCDLLNTAPKLKFVQLDSAGANQYKSLREEIILCNASGAYDTAISEHMLACTLAVMKKIYAYEQLQKEHCWKNLGSVPTIQNMKVLSVGMGNIGEAYVQKMHLLGAEVSGVRRTLHDKPDYVKNLYTLNELPEIIHSYDIVALSLPETNETMGLFDEQMLRRMKQGAVLLNVGRGSAIVEKDLLRVMQDHHLSAACLDVTEVEPLPENSPLYECENVYVTPHIAGRFNAEVTYEKVLHIFETNLKHFLNNEEMEHVVNKKLGY